MCRVLWFLGVCAAVLGTGVPASAQSGVGGTSRPYVKMDSAGMKVRVIGLQWSARRNVLLADVLTSGSTVMRGVEGLVSGESVELLFRYADGKVGDIADREVDTRLLLGEDGSGLELGFVQRSMPARPDTTSNLARIGVRLSYPIGGSGATVQFGGGGLFAPRGNPDTGPGGRRNDFGWDAETMLRYQPVRWNIPAEIMMGYRLAVLRTARHEEERGIVMIGAGLSLSGR